MITIIKYLMKNQIIQKMNKYLEFNKKIAINENLSLIIQILENAQENYQDNCYNNNINNIIYKYYESKDKNTQKISSKDVYSGIQK